MEDPMQEELMRMEDNIVPNVEIDPVEFEESDIDLYGVNDENNDSNSNLNEMHRLGLNMRQSISAYLGMDTALNQPKDDPCPLYFVSILTLLYFPIGIIIMTITCCGCKLNPNTQPKKVRAYKLMMFATIVRIGFQMLLAYSYGVSIFNVSVWVLL
eukprot:437626_1